MEEVASVIRDLQHSPGCSELHLYFTLAIKHAYRLFLGMNRFSLIIIIKENWRHKLEIPHLKSNYFGSNLTWFGLSLAVSVFHIAEIHIQSWVLQSDSKIKWRMMSKHFIMKTAQRPVIYCSLAGKRKLSFHNSLWWCDSAIPPLNDIISIAVLTHRCLVEVSMLMRQKGKLTWDTLMRAPQVRVTISIQLKY